MISLKKDHTFRSFLIFFVCIFSFSALANLRGTDIQNFSPTSNGLDFVTVHSARTLKPYELNFGVFFDYITNSLSYSKSFRISNGQKFGDPKDSIFYSNVLFGVGILPGWDLGLSVGSTGSQQIEGEPNYLFFYDVKGLNEIRINSKVNFFESKDTRFALVGGLDFQRIKSNPFSGNNPGPIFNMEAVADFRMSPDLLFAVNFGYRLRDEGSIIPNTGVVPISDQLIYSSAVSYKTDSEGSAVIGEIYGGVPVDETTVFTERKISNLELLVGYRFNGFKKFRFHGGLGTGIYQGLGSPDFRIYLGLNWRTDQIAKAIGFKKDEGSLQPVSLPEEKKDEGSLQPVSLPEEKKDEESLQPVSLPEEKKDEGSLQPVSLPEEKKDEEKDLSIKKEVDKELPKEMNKDLEDPLEKEKFSKENQQFVEDIKKLEKNTFEPLDVDPEVSDPPDSENTPPELYEDY